MANEGQGRSLRSFGEDKETGADVQWVDGSLEDESSPGDVLIKVEYSGLNYKDALAATGVGRVVRRFPLTLGIDAAGVVVESADPRHKPGDRVVVTGYGLSEQHDGGWAEYLRVPGDWPIHLEDSMTTEEAMAFGTAGLTAAIAVHRLEQSGLAPGQGPVAVTGASGGSGLLAVAMLAGLGHEVVAISGSPETHDILKKMGASSVEDRPDTTKIRPLETARWAGAVDAVGGQPLAWLLATTKPGGSIASFGNAAGNTLSTTVIPFILRGVNILGVTSAHFDEALRVRVWERMATDLRPADLGAIYNTRPLTEVHDAVKELLANDVTGRVVLKVGD
ncbi:acryloyl-CoA reductase [Rhodococcus sp. NPDC127530]|uniref:acrylyl-CoA reductase family protein n=1 Tax=unclassified Rhodococcus (in: high G+C Gram-positive bacteria) TaxID=192944 RepID=UPI00362CC25F